MKYLHSFLHAGVAGRRLLVAAVAALALAGGGCDDDITPDPDGQRISGRVFYDGNGFADFSRPTLQVAAFGIFPPVAAPHSLVSIVEPDFTDEGVAYELRDMPAFEAGYYVLAQMVDLDLEDPMSVPGPTGAFPDFCQLNATEGGVSVTDDEPTTGIDITLYDSAGAEDPCLLVASDDCPASAGRASVVVNVETTIDPTASEDSDALVVALFENAVGGPPAGFRVLPRTALEFPEELVFNDLAPGNYVVYACYDRGGDNSAGLCDPEEDTFAYYDDETPVPLAADTITTLSLDIDNGDSGTPEVQTAEEANCTN